MSLAGLDGIGILLLIFWGDDIIYDQDEPAQVGKVQETKVLKELNSLQQFQNDLWSRGTV